MKSHPLLALVLGALSLLSGSGAFGAAETLDEESRLIQQLQSNASAADKDSACSRLKWIGTSRSIPALAALLPDPQLSHSARYALESMAVPEAGQALLQALGATSGAAQAGIIDSLGHRRETRAVPELVQLLAASDLGIRGASATALGRIGGPVARSALQSVLDKGPGATRLAAIDALLRIGDQLLAEGNLGEAASLFGSLQTAETPAYVQIAVQRGLLLAAGDEALSAAIQALQGNDARARYAALQVARDLPGRSVTLALSGILPELTPAAGIAVVELLAQRNDASAAPGLMPLAAAADPPLRAAALAALGELGDASAVPLMLDAAVSDDDVVRAAGREALLVLHRGAVTQALLVGIPAADPSTLAELVRALRGRADPAAVSRLIEFAGEGGEATRAACLRALAVLADASHLGSLTALVLAAESDLVRTEARQALAGICQRTRDSSLDVRPIVAGIENAEVPVAARAALLEVGSLIIDPQVRRVTRAALRDPHPVISDAAIRAMCSSADPEWLPDLVELARGSDQIAYRALAIRGAVRLAMDESAQLGRDRPPVGWLAEIAAVAERPEDLRVVLAGLGRVADPAALELALGFLDKTEVAAEAALAATQVASAIAGGHRDLAQSALNRVLAVTGDPTRRAEIEAQLQEIAALADYLTAWEVSGPYRQDGKDYAALFDAVFPPETDRPVGMSWRLLPRGADSNRPWVFDLLKFLGGEQCVAYVRTRIQSEGRQSVVLELGTDDGVKAWLNGVLVHANNTARPLSVGSDKVNITLQPGENVLLLKITQNNLAWEFCARLASAEGVRVQ